MHIVLIFKFVSVPKNACECPILVYRKKFDAQSGTLLL